VMVWNRCNAANIAAVQHGLSMTLKRPQVKVERKDRYTQPTADLPRPGTELRVPIDSPVIEGVRHEQLACGRTLQGGAVDVDGCCDGWALWRFRWLSTSGHR
jgi:hypothetical protein